MPCLNEADTLATCIEKAFRAMSLAGLDGEVVVADNGSTDGSPAIAERLGARVVVVSAKGYGSALMGGIAEARGRFVLMGDADDSYDFLELAKFVAPLRDGFDLVQGCRLPAGGGRILPGAMPVLHRWWGNPMLSFLARVMFRVPVHDVYCGMRAFTRAHVQRLDLRCTGMEYATEMILKSALIGARIAQIPITLHPDGRKAHAPHLKTFRDGWRTLRFFLLSSPRWLFLVPAIGLLAAGFTGFALAMPGSRVLGASLDAHTLLVSSLAILLGFNTLAFAVAARVFAAAEGILPEDRRLERLGRWIRLEHGIVAGLALCAAGCVLILVIVNDWRLRGFGDLDYARTMRWVIPGTLLVALGFQTILSAFLVSLLRMRRR
jgi:glycosyltransferase involved in cell wall biosynthesis